MITENKVLLSRYRVEKKIGQGGFAQVFLATDMSLKRQVAVKVLNPELVETEGFLARFEQEAQAIAGFEHPNILSVYDYSKDDTTACLVTPYVEGGTVYDKLYREGKFSLGQASQYLSQVAAALDYAHRRHVVHRDIKPQNMLLRAEDNRLLLGDFGIAKVLNSAATQAHTSAIGTIYYMSPEQLQGNVGVGTDIYALGCVLFQMLTGELPYSGTTEQVMRGHLLDQVPSITARSRGLVPPAVQEVINRALAKRPEDRYRSAGEMARAFAAIITQPTYPTPPVTTFDPHRASTQVVQNPTYRPAYQPMPQPQPRPVYPTQIPVPAPMVYSYPALRPGKKSNGGLIAAVVIILVVAVVGGTVLLALPHNPGPGPLPPTSTPSTKGAVTTQPANNSIPAGFARFNSAAGRFSVIMPSGPASNSQKVTTPFGQVTVTAFQSVNSATQTGYQVAYNDYPDGSLDGQDEQDFLHGVLTGQQNAADATSAGDEKAQVLNGLQSRQTSYRTEQNGVAYVHLSRAYLVGNRLYQMIMVYEADNKPSDSLIDTFFGSMTINNN